MQAEWKHPAISEYPDYYGKYIAKVPEGNLIEFYNTQIKDAVSFFESIPVDKLSYRYAEGKWTIPQIVQHLSDAERIFSYRALRFARKDATPLPGFDENAFADEAVVNDRSWNDILDEFISVRRAAVNLFKSFSEEILSRSGTANNKSITVRSIAYIIAGHTAHHIAIIKERYL